MFGSSENVVVLVGGGGKRIFLQKQSHAEKKTTFKSSPDAKLSGSIQDGNPTFFNKNSIVVFKVFFNYRLPTIYSFVNLVDLQ